MPENTPGGMPGQGTPGQGGTPNPDGQQQQPQTPANFEEWLRAQPVEITGLYESHTKGLRSALESERTQRADLAKQLKEAAGKAEKGSELEKALNDATTRLEAAERKAEFMADANKAEIACSNPRAAYALATAEGLFDRKGNVDWTALKAAAPELFGRRAPAGNAGSGTQAAPQGGGMNEFIRRAAGRG